MAVVLFAFSLTTAFAKVVNPTSVSDLLNRIGGEGAAERFVTILDENLSSNGEEIFVITSQSEKPCIKGSTISAITTGINWYLNHYANVNLTWNQLTVNFRDYKFPVPVKEEKHETSADYRYHSFFLFRLLHVLENELP